jgi:peptidoglycan/xylan/chitin deacetylase (PgdA/CDA1 family)
MSLLPWAVWRFSNKEPVIYLTFDDGPHPNTTNQILEILNQFKAKATFFCTGKQIELYPELFNSIKNNGHQVGNHTYQHSNGLKINFSNYINEIIATEKYIQNKLFRPPYGKMSLRKWWFLRNKYKIIMWDVMGYDFDQQLSANDCADLIIKKAKSGSIIVLHENEKSSDKVAVITRIVLDHFSKKGFKLSSIPL